MSFYAHSHPKHPEDRSKWEPLFTEDCGTLHGEFCPACADLEAEHGHLNKVAYLAGKFAAEMFPKGSDEAETARQWGQLAGWWHDLGKFAPKWQEYLKNKVDPHRDDVSGKVPHSTSGAQFAIEQHPIMGHVLAFGIAGHHSGLLDTKSNGTCQWARLQNSGLPPIPALPKELRDWDVPPLPSFLTQNANAFSLSFFTRMLYSCLVDADFLATEAFMNSDSAEKRNQPPENALSKIQNCLQSKLDKFGEPAADDVVNQQRAKVLQDCREAAKQECGLFTLTVPTGGGKTLSSLSFALQHATKHGQKRIIYVVPFTSIIEQNAEVIRKIVAPLQTASYAPLIEHHSSFDPEGETSLSRLASENWDAPIIITTAVQFYESLFAARTSRSRKVHNIANSVVILDEAQTLSVDYLQPCLRAIQELSDHYNTTAVLCTATQPAIQKDEKFFPIGLNGCREIIQDTGSLFSALKRVEVNILGDLLDAELVERLNKEKQTLCIVNRRKHAQELFKLLSKNEAHFHLSALMCPEHRSQKLREVRQRLKDKLPIRLISTQLIEAGVDVDFPVVYRAFAGLDSIAQAAGRCNRNGEQAQLGQTYIFKPEDQKAEAYFRETAQVATQIAELHEDLLGEKAIQHYFDLYYYNQKLRWDKHRVLEDTSIRLDGSNPKLPFIFQYNTIAENFRLIDDWQVPVIIPYDDRAKRLISELGNESIPLHRNLLRSLQRYTVQIAPKTFKENSPAFGSLREGQFHALICTETHYSDDFGLSLDETYTSSQTLVCDG
jgi:CRISPR-associated endonuclease/helicase Cas3